MNTNGQNGIKNGLEVIENHSKVIKNGPKVMFYELIKHLKNGLEGVWEGFSLSTDLKKGEYIKTRSLDQVASRFKDFKI